MALAMLLAIGVWLILRSAKLPEYSWNWSLLLEFAVRYDANGHLQPGLLLLGLFTTLRIGLWTLLFSLFLGGILGMIYARRPQSRSLPYIVYVNLARNTPPLVILFSVYFFAGNILPAAEIDSFVRHLPLFCQEFVTATFASPGQMDRMLAAILALGLYQGAYVAEIVRAGIESVDNGQWDAAHALGFGKFATLRLVILPQAARLMLPPMTGQAITTFKDSALASLISLPDLTFQCLEAMAISSMTFEIWIAGAVLYLLTGGICAIAGWLLEKKLFRYIN